jgi:hypothetical protein
MIHDQRDLTLEGKIDEEGILCGISVFAAPSK